MKRLKAAWHQHPIITSGFVLAVIFTLLFAIRSVVFVVYWANPDHRDRALEGWMTPRYISKSWQLPQEVVIEALGLQSMPGRRITLEEIAAQQGVPVSELEARIAVAALEYRSTTQ